MSDRYLEKEQYGSDEQEMAELVEELEGYRTIIVDPENYTVEELRALLKKEHSRSRCEWCGAVLTDENLYNWTGYEAMVGPICKGCVKNVVQGEIK